MIAKRPHPTLCTPDISAKAVPGAPRIPDPEPSPAAAGERRLVPQPILANDGRLSRKAWAVAVIRDPVALLMVDPEDRSLLQHVTTMAKALTPVEMEWTAGVMMADEPALRHLASQRRPFHAAPGFLD